tara:strand:- start:292 stop:549 length:258 start_codon:yes stop_codon:yes gene_type:complete
MNIITIGGETVRTKYYVGRCFLKAREDGEELILFKIIGEGFLNFDLENQIPQTLAYIPKNRLEQELNTNGLIEISDDEYKMRCIQ